MYHVSRSGECSEEGDFFRREDSGVKARSLEELKWHFGRKLRDLSSPDDPMWRECTTSVDPVNAQRRVTFFKREDSDPPDDTVKGVCRMIRCHRWCWSGVCLRASTCGARVG